MTVQEIAPGIFRVESILGPRPFAQYLLRDERSLLVDTGIVSTPEDVILPALRDVGLDPADLDFIVISHADVDHFGGNAAMRAAAPRAVLCAHAFDQQWIGDRELILRERYGWYAAHGPRADYDAATKDWLQSALGPDVPIDLSLVGHEVFRLGPDLRVDVLHLPGHSPGHLGLWEPVSRTAIVMDAVLAGGLLDNEGTVIHPPPYFNVHRYQETIQQLRELEPRRLLTAHYPVIEGAAVDRFLAESLAFVERARAAVRDALFAEREMTLETLLARLNPVLGPFTSMPNELCGPIRGHLAELVLAGQAEEIPNRQPPAWRVMAR